MTWFLNCKKKNDLVIDWPKDFVMSTSTSWAAFNKELPYQLEICTYVLTDQLSDTDWLTDRPRVVSNFGDGDSGAGEIHAPAQNFEGTWREGSSKDLGTPLALHLLIILHVHVCILPAPQSPLPKLDSQSDWLTDWLTDWWTDWLTGELTDWPTNWLTYWQTDGRTDWLTDGRMDKLTDWMTDWMTGWLPLWQVYLPY